jgi:hypothetical protein
MKIKVRRTNGKYKGRKMDLNCKNSTVLLDGALRPETRPRLSWSKQGPGPVDCSPCGCTFSPDR